MKTLIVALLLIGMSSHTAFSQDHIDSWGDGTNPSVAVLLSIQPLPIDFGNFYTGNWKRGIGYSVIQSSLIVAAGFTLAKSEWSHNHLYRNDTNYYNRGLTSAERKRLIWYSVSYIAIKAISGIDAGMTAERNRQSMEMAMTFEKNSPVMSLRVSF